MSNSIIRVAYALTMAAVVVLADLVFFRNHSLERLIANVVIISGFVGIYLGLGGRPWSLRK